MSPFKSISFFLLLFSTIASAQESIDLGELVHSSAVSTECDAVDPDGLCLMSWKKAAAFCEKNHSHLPTAAEYAESLKPYGIQVLSVAEFQKQTGLIELSPGEIVGLPRKNGFYKVACEADANGVDPSFYRNDFSYSPSAPQKSHHKFWTASSPPGHPEAAHVVYDQWGGGGGLPKEHLKTAHHSFRCVK